MRYTSYSILCTMRNTRVSQNRQGVKYVHKFHGAQKPRITMLARTRSNFVVSPPASTKTKQYLHRDPGLLLIRKPARTIFFPQIPYSPDNEAALRLPHTDTYGLGKSTLCVHTALNWMRIKQSLNLVKRYVSSQTQNKYSQVKKTKDPPGFPVYGLDLQLINKLIKQAFVY
jgi:hypothetical protein